MDTARDYRILLVEDALRRIEAIIKAWSLPYPINKSRARSIVGGMRGNLLRLKYSFMPASMMLKAEEYEELISGALRLREELLPPRPVNLSPRQKLRLATIKYALWMILGLGGRLMLGEDNLPEYAVDVIGVEVTRASQHPELRGLTVTRASTGTAVLTIVTSIKDVKEGEVRGAAILPPAMFGEVVSEAMYTGEPVPDGKLVGKRLPLSLVGSEVRAAVLGIVSRHGGKH